VGSYEFLREHDGLVAAESILARSAVSIHFESACINSGMRGVPRENCRVVGVPNKLTRWNCKQVPLTEVKDLCPSGT